MTYEEIKRRLDDRIDTDKGDSFTCQCPGHEDDKASLSVAKGKDGRIVLHCFAGCDVGRILQPIGLTVKDLFAAKPDKRASDPVVARYDYRNATGEVVFRVERRQSKKFVQCKPDPKEPGKWIYKLQGVRRVLYRLPELLASDPAGWVFICEGEKDADNLRRHGYTATTNAGGAGKWIDSYSEALQDRRVVLLPDNDEPGREHARIVGGKLAEHVSDLRVLELPDLPAKGDVSDWLNAGNDPGALAGLADQAPTWAAWAEQKPSAQPEATEGASAACLKMLAGMGYAFSWNELDDTIEVNEERLNAGIEATIRTQMRDQGWKGMEALQDVWTAEAYRSRYHPMKRYLEGLKWDGENHLGKLATYVKDAHPMIVYPSGKKSSVFLIWFVRWAVGAIAKLYEAGIVRGQNPMLVLDGGQNLGKSTFVRWLASPFPDLFIEDAIRPDDKEHLRYLTSKFIWEVSELGATTRRADREALKAFITKGEATFRKPYDRNPIVKPALASFIGTINNENGFLTDRTGNRRFLAVTLKSINWRYTEQMDPDQLWAQAFHLYRNGEPWQLNETETTRRDGLNSDYEVEDTLEGWVHKIAQVDPERDDWRATSAELTEALQNWGVKGTTRAIQTELGSTLRAIGLRQDANARPRQWLGIQIIARQNEDGQ